jgi:hypothetical protein
VARECVDAIARLAIPYFDGAVVRCRGDSERIDIDTPDAFNVAAGISIGSGSKRSELDW